MYWLVFCFEVGGSVMLLGVWIIWFVFVSWLMFLYMVILEMLNFLLMLEIFSVFFFFSYLSNVCCLLIGSNFVFFFLCEWVMNFFLRVDVFINVYKSLMIKYVKICWIIINVKCGDRFCYNRRVEWRNKYERNDLFELW